MKPLGKREGALVFAVAVGLLGASCATYQNIKSIKNDGHLSELHTDIAKPGVITRTKIQATYSKLPLSFEANLGQHDPQVKFLSRGPGYTLFLTATEAVLVLEQQTEEAQVLGSRAVVRMNLVNANHNPVVVGLDILPGKVNHLFGNDPMQWRTNVPVYAKVKYKEVYPGVDLVYYGNQRQLEYDFAVAPGADPTLIEFALEGANRVEVDGQGDLVLSTISGEIRLHRPSVYQEINDTKHNILGRYVLRGPQTQDSGPKTQMIGFQVTDYDVSSPLIIDPVLSYSTYLGGGSDDSSGGDPSDTIAVDHFGNAYVTGYTTSTDFPTGNPLQAMSGGNSDVFVAKLNATGTALIYSTYFGGRSDNDGQGIAVDSGGNVYVTGLTGSDFPTLNPVQAVYGGGVKDAFVAKLNASGTALIYSTYLGGSGGDRGADIAVDAAGNAYVTGLTMSPNFPTANPLQAVFGGNGDVFVTKLNASGTALIYSTYLGGIDADSDGAIAVDTSGNAYVTGNTFSSNFPLANPLQNTNGGLSDAFVAKINTSGTALVYSTYLGGNRNEFGHGIAVDSAGNVYVTGDTASSDFPIANSLQAALGGDIDAFVTKLNAGGTMMVYSTYLGGSGDDFGDGIAVDDGENSYITGNTSSSNFPTAAPLQAHPNGGRDAFVSKLNPSGSALVYSTYLGGRGYNLGKGIAVDRDGGVYVAGTTNSTSFPTVNALQAAWSGASDTFVLKIGEVMMSPLEGVLEDPTAGSFQSGIGLIRGWVCDANKITIEIDGVAFNAAYGTTRADTRSACGDDDNGFGLTFNWNLVGDGQHRVRALADGVVFGDVTFTVTTLGLGQFPRGLSGTYTLSNFPQAGKETTVRWHESGQNFVIIGAGAGGGSGNGGASPRVLEDPAPGSFQSGIGLIRGWVCDATKVTIEIDGVAFNAAYGTTRADTRSACGDDNNGFGLTFNWNLVGDGQHRVRALADGVVFADVTFTVTTLGLGQFPRGLSGEYVLESFPQADKKTTVRWQESIQNFIIVDVEQGSAILPTGAYKGALEATSTDCEPEEDDDEFELSGSITVTNNTGSAFHASGALSIDRGGFTFTLNIDFAGMSTTQGNVSGNYNTDFRGTNGFTSHGSGTFQGSITSTSLTLNLTGQDTDIFGTTCILRGTFTGLR